MCEQNENGSKDRATEEDDRFSFWIGSVARGDAVEVEGGAELGEGVRVGNIEERVVVHIEGQRQAVALKSGREEVEVSQQVFGMVKAGSGVEAGGVVHEFKEGLIGRGVGEPGVGTIILPEL